MKTALVLFVALFAATLVVGVKISRNLDGWYLCRSLGYGFGRCVTEVWKEGK